jgi:hypothetical protein
MIDRLKLIEQIKELSLDLAYYYGDCVKIEININKRTQNCEINITVKNIK